MQLQNHPDIIARLARGDVNMATFDGFPLEEQISEVNFEAATYEILRDVVGIPATHLLYHRVPARIDGPRLRKRIDIRGRRLMIFQKPEGIHVVWRELDKDQQVRETKSMIVPQYTDLR